MLNKSDGYSSQHCRYLFKEHIFPQPIPHFAALLEHSHVNQAPWAFGSDES